ncbi:uncharacterized protein MAL13P1.304-like [Zerene cesonia]|uniref:uncharacterized protein MAL13P1.304-like n=1 Tax=Zerene cesonia TaxID=33412 RepID=UPI0018E561AE|nr:uncharacterized protein MAL13P1.304-like [Zerene cesonia]
MELLRQIIVSVIIINFINTGYAASKNDVPIENTTHNCPFTRFIEDIFKIHNKTSPNSNTNDETTKLFLDVIDNLENNDSNKQIQEELVNSIIESIKRIKENVSRDIDDLKLNEAIMLNETDKNYHFDNVTKTVSGLKILNQVRSGIEERIDMKITEEVNNSESNNVHNETNKISDSQYVEILTIEPNNTNIANASNNNILEVLKHIMPLFNSSANKQLHSITIIERNENKNHSFSETKNTSTVVVKYCEKDNLTQDTDLEKVNNETVDDDDYYLQNDDYDLVTESTNTNVSSEGFKDILEAAEYGIQKSNELYDVLEPKLYSMGLWLDEKSPARYVAAFNAPSEDLAKFSRYGYASILAAEKLKELSGDALESRTEEGKFPKASALRDSPLLEQCPLRAPPKCPPASKRCVFL